MTMTETNDNVTFSASLAGTKMIEVRPLPNVFEAKMEVLERPEPIKKRFGKRLTNTRLKKLAEKYKPPRSWYDSKEEKELY